MSSVSSAPGNTVLTRALCMLIVAIMVAAVIYSAWIGISNFSRIGV
jgi:hypothetical protein